MTPVRFSCSFLTRPSTSAAISGVSGAPARRTICTPSGSSSHARRKPGSPFCLVIRPTKTTVGRSGSIPCFSRIAAARSSASSPTGLCHLFKSIPLWMTWTRLSSTSGYDLRMSAFMPLETATIASAFSYATLSTKEETRYPPPNCSIFHGRSGSKEWAEITKGMS